MPIDRDEIEDAVKERVSKMPKPFLIAAGVVLVMMALMIFTDIGKAIFGG